MFVFKLANTRSEEKTAGRKQEQEMHVISREYRRGKLKQVEIFERYIYIYAVR